MRLERWTPGVVESFDEATKLARVRFDGALDGAEELPEAQLNYPIGDKSHHTDIRMLPGDLVWLDFIGGDPRYPIILGYRPKETGNATGVRRMHHAKMEFVADSDMLLSGASGTVTISAGTKIRLVAPEIELDGPTTVTGLLRYLSGIEGTGPATSNGKDVSNTHRHTGVDTGSGNSGPPL
jgi:hypothetical protein